MDLIYHILGCNAQCIERWAPHGAAESCDWGCACECAMRGSRAVGGALKAQRTLGVLSVQVEQRLGVAIPPPPPGARGGTVGDG